MTQDRPRTDQVAPSPGPGTGIHQAGYSGITTHGPAAFGNHNIVNQVSYRSVPPTHADDVLVSRALEALAGQVESERRRDEERSQVLRRPLPVRWAVTAAGSAMAEVDRSSIGVTDDRLPAGGLDDLAGLLARRLPHRRLVILGTAGAGKTVLATRLVRGLLRERVAGEPVPVLLPADTWHPGEQHLREWMAQRLAQDHPHLGGPAPAPGRSRNRRTMATHLIESRLVLPVLDGLDMIGDGLLGTALSELNGLGVEEPLVVTSRIEPYRNAVQTADCGLSGAVVAEVLPLTLAEARNYLAPAGGSGRWHRAFAALTNDPDAPLTQALRTPLMAWLARTNYPTAAPTAATDPATTVADPQELGDRTRFPDQDAIADHLIDGLLPAVYPAEPTPTSRRGSDERWHRQDVERALIFLARHLRRTDTHEIAWWRLDRAVRHQRTLWIPLLIALYGLFFGLGHSLTAGLAMGTVMGLVGTSRRARTKLGWVASETPYRTKVSFRRLRVTLWYGLVSTTKLVVPLLAGLVLLSVPEPGPLVITAGVLLLLTTAVLLVRQTWRRRERDLTRELVVPADTSRAVSPISTLRGDRAAGLMIVPPMILLGAPPAILFGTVRPIMVATAFVIGWIGAGAWARYTVARAVLAARGHLPWRTMAFLDDAVDRGVLRRVGAAYQFRHPRLRDRLAEYPR
ncbi:hypothetical protein B5D80_00625 [Micromonospora wenchangensis]|uniref:NACHT domain-containing protein n=1 Tax=Micromonospora wenchangensis TaxID=1185415 RepID=A0A246RTU8_9ACTN|nr:hypothetical protein [Micromonospora wenchangensis]OWV13674.1 hypothetical protein B5D80_00625 [Micromonospora wenchangensis]